MASADEKTVKIERTPKPLGGVSFADYVDMSAAEREDFHKRHFRGSARFERAMLEKEDREGHGGLATVLVIGVLAGGAFLLWRAAKAEGRPIYRGSPLDFLKQGPVLAGVVGGGVGAATGLLIGSSPAKLAMLGAGVGLVGSALNPAYRHKHEYAQPAQPASTTRGQFVGAPTNEEIFHAQFKLGQLGYNVGLDGKISPALTEALKKFQATYNLLTTDGTINRETLAYLDQVVHQTLTAPNPETGLHDRTPTWA